MLKGKSTVILNNKTPDRNNKDTKIKMRKLTTKRNQWK